MKHKAGAGWDNDGKPGNQVATKSMTSHEISYRNPAIITLYLKFINEMNESGADNKYKFKNSCRQRGKPKFVVQPYNNPNRNVYKK